MLNKVYLSVIIPAYNEEKRLPKTLLEIDKYLRTKDYNYEIIVVSDGSKDKTAEVVRGSMSKIQNLRLIENKVNHGKGYAVRQGMLEAKGKYQVFTDADNSTSINQVEKMWPHFREGFDIIIGSRDIRGAVLAVPQTWLRRRLGDVFNLSVQVLTGLWKIWDTQCGFKGFTEKVVKDIFPKCKIDGFSFDPEILILAKRAGYTIKVIPVNWINDPESKVKLKSMVKMGLDLVKIRLNLLN